MVKYFLKDNKKLFPLSYVLFALKCLQRLAVCVACLPAGRLPPAAGRRAFWRLSKVNKTFMSLQIFLEGKKHDAIWVGQRPTTNYLSSYKSSLAVRQPRSTAKRDDELGEANYI
jgi:hypothetical protein